MSVMRTQGEWRGELQNRRRDGSEFWVSANVVALRREGMGTVWITVHTDITGRRQAEQARDLALAQLRRLALNRQEALEAERLSVSRDVHDQLGAALTGMRMRLEALALQADQAGGAGVAPAALLALADTARQTQVAAREICTRLRPQSLDDLGLVETCRWYLQDWSAQVGIGARGRFGPLREAPDDALATDLFRILQELLTNVARHAGAHRVCVLLLGGAQGLALRVRDDGHGFDTACAARGFGLLGVQERVRQHRGRYALSSGARGTCVSVFLPRGVAP